MFQARLADRALIQVAGPDAGTFLQNIVTVDLDGLAPGELKPGALLSPQGKILFDFLVSRDGDRFLLECRADIADDFVRRLMLYRLRAKVEIAKSDQVIVEIFWERGQASSETDSAAAGTTWLRDRRFADLGVFRSYREGGGEAEGDEAWRALRIQHGVAESGEDYELGDAFPHDVLLDQLGGIGFTKGCYVGQEVVSRMQHRGTARRRVLVVTGADALPPTGTEITADGRVLGPLGSVSGQSALAVLRIDRVKDMMDAGTEITAAGVPLRFSIPPSASFTFPGDDAGSDEA